MRHADLAAGDDLLAIGVELFPGLRQLGDAGVVQHLLVRPQPVDAVDVHRRGDPMAVRLHHRQQLGRDDLVPAFRPRQAHRDWRCRRSRSTQRFPGLSAERPAARCRRPHRREASQGCWRCGRRLRSAPRCRPRPCTSRRAWRWPQRRRPLPTDAACWSWALPGAAPLQLSARTAAPAARYPSFLIRFPPRYGSLLDALCRGAFGSLLRDFVDFWLGVGWRASSRGLEVEEVLDGERRRARAPSC